MERQLSISYKLSQIHSTADKIIKWGEGFNVWLFYGEMGVGKTTLIKEICHILEVIDQTSSPTFSIINEYATSDKKGIYHFDFYRLRHESEAFNIGVDEYFYSDALCLVEWPEKIPSLIPQKHISIKMEIVDDSLRKIFLNKTI